MSVIHRKGQRESKRTYQLSDEEMQTAFTRPAGARPAGELRTPEAEVAWVGRNVEIPDHFRAYVGDKLARIENFDSAIDRFEVVLYHEPNRRQSKQSQVIEITAVRPGPVIRTQGSGENFYAATELAMDKLKKGVRRAKARTQHIRKDGSELSLAEIAADISAEAAPAADIEAVREYDDGVEPHEPGQIVREKDHEASPMTVDEALYEMELVGHDFFLFQDADSGKPSVVYRRHAFDYGLIRLV